MPLLTIVTKDRFQLGAMVVVDTPEDVAVARLIEQRGFTEEDAWSRVAAQIDRDERRRLADVVIDNSDGPVALEAEIDRVWAWLQEQRAAGRLDRHRVPVPSTHARLQLARQFQVVSDFGPAGDQPTAIAQLSEGVAARRPLPDPARHHGQRQERHHRLDDRGGAAPDPHHRSQQVARRAAGQRDAGVLPRNRVEYFVSYYDYYQPEAYLPSSDTYIEKDSSINDEIDRLRHSATSALLTRRDTIVVASVSCIYGLGSPEEYADRILHVQRGAEQDQRAILRRLVDMQYERNDANLVRGKFRVRGDTIEVHPAYEEHAVRIELFGDEIERISTVDTLTGEKLAEPEELVIFPATHYVAGDERMQRAIGGIEARAAGAPGLVRGRGQAARGPAAPDAYLLRPGDAGRGGRVLRHRELQPAHRRPPGRQPPHTLLDFFPKDYLLVIDESHQTVPAAARPVRGGPTHARRP